MDALYKVTIEGLCNDEDACEPEYFAGKQNALDHIKGVYENSSWEIDNVVISKCEFENGKLVEKQIVLELTYQDLDNMLNKDYYGIIGKIDKNEFDGIKKEILKKFDKEKLETLSTKIKDKLFDIRNLDSQLEAVTALNRIDEVAKEKFDLSKDIKLPTRETQIEYAAR